jgi:hypothetical protein
VFAALLLLAAFLLLVLIAALRLLTAMLTTTLPTALRAIALPIVRLYTLLAAAVLASRATLIAALFLVRHWCSCEVIDSGHRISLREPIYRKHSP